MIRSIAIVIAAMALLSLAPAQGRAEVDYPWCSISSTGQSGMPACRFATVEQCQASIGGGAGFCQRNSRIVAREQAVRRGAR